MENINIIYFSPTDSTEKITRFVGKEFSEDYGEIDISYPVNKEYNFSNEELCIVGVPSFGGRVPDIAVERLKKLKGDKTPCILVVSYGNRDYDDTFLELKEVLEGQDFLPISAMAVVAQHSIMKEVGKKRPEEDDYKELKVFVESIKEKIEEKKIEEIKVPGNSPYRDFDGVPFKPKTSKKCIDCGLCQKTCPVGAIPVDNFRETDKDKCITCMRCIKRCPKNARKLNPILPYIASRKMLKANSERKENELFL